MPELLEMPVLQEEAKVGNRFPLQLTVGVLLLVAYSLLTKWFRLETGLRSNFSPLYAWWKKPAFISNPSLALFSVVPLLLFAGWQWFIRRQMTKPLPMVLLMTVAIGFVAVFNISICLMDGGRTPGRTNATYPAPCYEIVRPFDYPGAEFTTDVHFVHSPEQFLHDYVSLHGWLALHSRTHPPGPVLFLWGVQRLFGYHLMPMALAAIGITALSIIPAFLTARRLYGQNVAMIALALMAVTPSMVLYGATSMDGVYTLPLLTSLYLFVAATQVRSPKFRVVLAAGLGVMMVIASLMTFATSCIGILFGAYALLAWLRLRHWKRVWGVLLIAAGTFVVSYVALQLITGYNVLDCVKVSMHSDSEVMGARAAGLVRYLDVSTADLTAFLVGTGIAVALLLAGQVRTAVTALAEKRNFDPMLVAFVGTLVFLSFSTLFRWETERIWVFMAPLAIFAAAKQIIATGRSLQFAMVALFVQTYLMQMFLFTLW